MAIFAVEQKPPGADKCITKREGSDEKASRLTPHASRFSLLAPRPNPRSAYPIAQESGDIQIFRIYGTRLEYIYRFW